MQYAATDIIVAGGGLAGLTCAIHLAASGCSVRVIEKDTFPHHKVCGEYVSNEVLPYLDWLGVDPFSLGAVPISRLEYSDTMGNRLSTDLSLGGFGLSRYTFDKALYNRATAAGAVFCRERITGIEQYDNGFRLATASGKAYSAAIIIGAFGKRSSIDKMMARDFMAERSPWMAVKAHYHGRHDDDVVGLHRFPGGYCGISRVENDTVNLCYLVHQDSFRRYKDLDTHREQVLGSNKVLRTFLRDAVCLFDRPLTISQVSFSRKAAVEDGILMCGDSAGLINPLCGNGMAMAIGSARIASELVRRFLSGDISREQMEHFYAQQWRSTYGSRIRAGSGVAFLLRHTRLSGLLARAATYMPGILPAIIKRTHGTPIKMDTHVAGLTA